MTTKTKPTVEEADLQTQLAKITADLEQAERAVEEAEQKWSLQAGKAILEEASDTEVAAASQHYQDAQAKASALRSARSLVEQRKTAQEAQEQADRVSRLREQSDTAHRAQMAALGAIARASAELVLALEDARAEGDILDGIHRQLSAAHPERQVVVDQDHRDALAGIRNGFAQNRGAVHELAAQAQYRLQAPADATDPVLTDDVFLLEDQVAEKGTRYSVARPAVTAWQVKALAALDDDERAEIEDEYQEFASRTLTSGLGALPASGAEIRSAAALDLEQVAQLVPEQVARDLAGLEQYLPASAYSPVSVRTIRPKSALDAVQEEQRLQSGRQAIAALVG